MLHHTINGTLQMPSCIYPNTISEIISDTVDFPPNQFNMPKMSSKDTIIHDAHDLICALHNPAPAISLVKLGNSHKEALRTLSEIFRKQTPPAVPPRVLVRGAYQEKFQKVNQ